VVTTAIVRTAKSTTNTPDIALLGELTDVTDANLTPHLADAIRTAVLVVRS
jgi:hypothetical protein